MKSRLDGEPIVPMVWRQTGDQSSRPASEKDIREGVHLLYTNGLTKREYFAGLAMQGLIVLYKDYDPGDYAYLAICSTKAADALITELNKETI